MTSGNEWVVKVVLYYPPNYMDKERPIGRLYRLEGSNTKSTR